MSDALSSLGLAGRVALVTGAAGGIGAATCRCLVELGCRVAAADLRAEPCARLRDTLPGGASRHHAIRLDLGDAAACEVAVAETVGRFGRVDILVNAGAVLHRQALDAVDAASFRRQMEVNAAGPLFLARAAAAAMKRQGSGSIVLVSSVAAFAGAYHDATAYAMTKGAVITLMKSLARELGGHGVRVNAIAPGTIDTPMIRDTTPPEVVERLRAAVPLGRLGEPEDIARCCAFLASDWASYVTGQTLVVNGGQAMG